MYKFVIFHLLICYRPSYILTILSPLFIVFSKNYILNPVCLCSNYSFHNTMIVVSNIIHSWQCLQSDKIINYTSMCMVAQFSHVYFHKKLPWIFCSVTGKPICCESCLIWTAVHRTLGCNPSLHPRDFCRYSYILTLIEIMGTL